LRIYRNLPILSGHLNAMSCKNDDRQIGALSPLAKFNQCMSHIVMTDIDQRFHRKTRRDRAAAKSLAPLTGLGRTGTF
jgi:hypothetical protein